MGGSFWSRIRLGKAVAGPARFGAELDWEKLWRDQVFGAKMTETNGHKLLFSFWSRIRLGKAVAGPGVRGQDDRDKWTQTSFFLGIQRRR